MPESIQARMLASCSGQLPVQKPATGKPGLVPSSPDFFKALPRTTFQRARAEAIKGTDWTLASHALVIPKSRTQSDEEAEAMKMAA
jgi:hypothetical protein